MGQADPKALVLQFNDCINAGDVEGLGELMHPDHRFIDAGGNKFEPKAFCLKLWAMFFEGFPDYRNYFEEMNVEEGADGEQVVTVIGRSECSLAELNGPAIWRAVVTQEGLVKEWRVWNDTLEVRWELGMRN